MWCVFERDFTNFGTKMKVMWPSLIYCLVFLVGLLFSDNMGNALKTLEKQTSFLLFPFLVVCIPWNKDRYKWFSKSFCFGVLLICIWSLIKLFYFWYTRKEFIAEMNDNYLQWKLPHLVGYHPTYMGMLIVSATIILIDNSIGQNKGAKTYFVLALVCFLTAFLLYLSPRMAVFLQFLVLVTFAFRTMAKKSLSPGKILLILGLFLAGVLVASKSNFLMSKWNRSFTDSRFFLWPYAFEEIRENYFVYGEGLGNGKVVLENTLKNIKDTRTSYRGFDLHNQFLVNYLDFGLFGLLSLLSLFFIPIVNLRTNTLILFMVTFALSMITESTLTLIKGIILFNVMSTLLIRNAIYEKFSI